MKIALDAMGGDLAPKAVIEGAVLAARDFGVEIVLTGDRETITRELHTEFRDLTTDADDANPDDDWVELNE